MQKEEEKSLILLTDVVVPVAIRIIALAVYLLIFFITQVRTVI